MTHRGKCKGCDGKTIVCCCGKTLNGNHDHNSCGPPEPCDDCSGTGEDADGVVSWHE